MISSIDTHHKPQKDVKKVFHGLEGPRLLGKIKKTADENKKKIPFFYCAMTQYDLPSRWPVSAACGIVFFG